MSLAQEAEQLIAGPLNKETYYRLLSRAVSQRDQDALQAVRRLYEDMYGGITFNYEMKAPAAHCLLCWGERGLEALFEGAYNIRASKNASLCIQILASVAAKATPPLLGFLHDEALRAEVHRSLQNSDLGDMARKLLVRYVLSAGDDIAIDLIPVLGHVYAADDPPRLIETVVAALAARWLAISEPVLFEYENLMAASGDNEPVFQRFLTSYPQLLDPMASEVWAMPDFHGAHKPDFVIRRTDDTYVIVEIEKPAKPLVTALGQLSAEVTQAERQVTDYRTFLTRRIAEAQRMFPRLEDPDGLVVIGLERSLTPAQRETLDNANRHRNRLRILGFDHLSTRARSISRNIIESGVRVHKGARLI